MRYLPSFRNLQDSPASALGRSTSTHPLELLIALLIVLLPFTIPVSVIIGGGTSRGAALTFFPFDLALVLLTGAGMPLIAARIHRRKISGAGVLFLTAAALILMRSLIDPEPVSVQVALRVLTAAFLAVILEELGAAVFRGPIIYAIGAVGVEQAILAVGQVGIGRGLGFTALGLGEKSVALLPVGGEPAARGTFLHPYILAGVAMVMATVLLAAIVRRGRRSLGLWLAVAATAVPLGLTYSRMSVLAVGALLIACLTSSANRLLHVYAASGVVVGVLVPALLTRQGWIARVAEGRANDADADAFTSGRLTLVGQAWQLIEKAPAVGVGVGRYIDSIQQANPTLEKILYVHNVPLLVTAESGVIAGIVFCAFLAALAFRALLPTRAALSIFLGFIPFLLLDHFAYSRPQGLALLGLWTGAVLAATRITAGRSQECAPRS